MKTLKVNWKDINIMNILCYDNLFFNLVEPENLIEARKKGFVLNTISNVPIISLELPNFIKSRIPHNVDAMLHIKATKCLLETDSLSIDLMEN